MPTLARQRCLHHVEREAVARCPECGEFFCRECITEHDDRVICASCLKKVVQEPVARRRRFRALDPMLRGGAGLLAAWLYFYCIGRVLVSLPASFHEGTLWQENWLQTPLDEP